MRSPSRKSSDCNMRARGPSCCPAYVTDDSRRLLFCNFGRCDRHHTRGRTQRHKLFAQRGVSNSHGTYSMTALWCSGSLLLREKRLGFEEGAFASAVRFRSAGQSYYCDLSSLRLPCDVDGLLEKRRYPMLGSRSLPFIGASKTQRTGLTARCRLMIRRERIPSHCPMVWHPLPRLKRVAHWLPTLPARRVRERFLAHPRSPP
jgi:hypothetical protein